jgi:hypothetical protein
MSIAISLAVSKFTRQKKNNPSNDSQLRNGTGYLISSDDIYQTTERTRFKLSATRIGVMFHDGYDKNDFGKLPPWITPMMGPLERSYL